MENVQHTWKQTTAELYKAVLIFTLAGVAVSVFAFILSITATVDVVAALNSGDRLIGRGYGVWNILSVVATVAVLYGYWLFIRGSDASRTRSSRRMRRLSPTSARRRC